MGFVYATIELINGRELANVRYGLMDQDLVKRLPVEMLVDTGSISMCINETICEALNLSVDIVDKRKFSLADGSIIECPLVGPIEVRFKNRSCVVSAVVLPGDTECLLGAIPLEAMDVLIDPNRRELIVNPEHPDYAVLALRSVFRLRYDQFIASLRKNHSYVRSI